MMPVVSDWKIKAWQHLHLRCTGMLQLLRQLWLTYLLQLFKYDVPMYLEMQCHYRSSSHKLAANSYNVVINNVICNNVM